MGKNANPTFIKLITRSDDIQIDSVRKSIKLATDINKEEEKELKKAEEDLFIEKTEATCYNMLIKKSRILDQETDAVPILEQNLREEQSMIDWIESNCPTMIQQLVNK